MPLAPPGETAELCPSPCSVYPSPTLPSSPLITWVGQANNYRYALGLSLFGTLAFAAMFAWLPAMKTCPPPIPSRS
ncbi:MAG: hypothetical protein U1U88_001912 [Lawsonella clevelandensis]